MNTQQRAAVQQALEFIERTSTYLPTSFDQEGISIHTALRQLLEQAEQGHDLALEQALTRLQKRYTELEAKVVTQPADLNLNCKSVQARLAAQWGYVRPSTWVGLTDEEILKIKDIFLLGNHWSLS